MTVTTTTTFDPGVNYVFQHVFLRNAKARCVYYAGVTEGSGVIDFHADTFSIKWRRYENMTPTTTALTQISTESYPFRSGATLTKTDYTATVQKYGDVIFMNEEVDLVNPSEQGAKLMEVLGIQAGRSLNRLQRNELEDNGTFYYAGGATSDATVTSQITGDAIRRLVNVLDRNTTMSFSPMTLGDKNIGTGPIMPSYWGVCHVDVRPDIELLPGFVTVAQYGNQIETLPGEFGYSGRVRFIATEEASIDLGLGGPAGSALRQTNTQADLYSTVIFGQDYHGAVGFGSEHVKKIYTAGDPIPPVQIISHDFGSAGAVDPLNEIATKAWKAWHAAKILNPLWGGTIRSGASLLNG